MTIGMVGSASRQSLAVINASLSSGGAGSLLVGLAPDR